MDIKTHTQDNYLVVILSGKMDAVTAPLYIDRLREELCGDVLRMVVDCGNLVYVSSAGLRAILTVSKDIRLKGGSQAYCSLQHQVREIFELSGFSSIIPIHDNRDDALASLT